MHVCVFVCVVSYTFSLYVSCFNLVILWDWKPKYVCVQGVMGKSESPWCEDLWLYCHSHIKVTLFITGHNSLWQFLFTQGQDQWYRSKTGSLLSTCRKGCWHIQMVLWNIFIFLKPFFCLRLSVLFWSYKISLVL